MRAAAILRCPVFFMAGLYRGKNTYHVVFEQVADFSVMSVGRRDLAVRAMVELQGAAGNVTTTRDDARAARIKREGELRREAAGVVTGAPHTPPPVQSPFMQAMYDLAGAGGNVTRVRDDARAARIRREGELRREAAGVVTGSPHTPPPQQSPLMAAMEEEWKARGQWRDE